jgi:hypothetical protein
MQDMKALFTEALEVAKVKGCFVSYAVDEASEDQDSYFHARHVMDIVAQNEGHESFVAFERSLPIRQEEQNFLRACIEHATIEALMCGAA